MHCKWLNSMVCELYLNKGVKKKKNQQCMLLSLITLLCSQNPHATVFLMSPEFLPGRLSGLFAALPLCTGRSRGQRVSREEWVPALVLWFGKPRMLFGVQFLWCSTLICVLIYATDVFHQNKPLLRAHCVPGTVLDARDTAVKETKLPPS